MCLTGRCSMCQNDPPDRITARGGVSCARRSVLITPDDLAGVLRSQILDAAGARGFADDLNAAAALLDRLDGRGIVFRVGETLAEYLPKDSKLKEPSGG